MSEPAKFTGIDPSTKKSVTIPVNFNPSSLQQSVNNKLKDDKNGNQPQTVQESVTKLTMELVFDTTDAPDGGGKFVSVCNQTGQLAALMGRQKQIPPQVKFEWGTFSFEGMIDSFRETIDFFAEDGTPLRSTVSLGMTAQDKVFTPVNGATGEDDASGGDTGTGGGGDEGTSEDTGGGENPRFPPLSSTPPAAPPKAVKLGPPTAFASGGAGIGFGAGIGISAGIGFGASAGFGFGASAGIGFGASAGFGFSASAGASFGASAGFSAGAGASFGASAGGIAGASFGASAGGIAGASFGASAGGFAGASFGASAGAGGVFASSSSAGGVFSASGGGIAGASFGGGAVGVAGASFGASAGFSAGAGASFGVSASGGAYQSTGASFTAGAAFPTSSGAAASGFSVNVWSGAQASAGVPALQGAFLGLRSAPARPATTEVTFIRQISSQTYVAGSSATFELGGQIRSDRGPPPSSLTVRTRIRFFED